MKNLTYKTLYIAWAAMFVLTAALGFAFPSALGALLHERKAAGKITAAACEEMEEPEGETAAKFFKIVKNLLKGSNSPKYCYAMRMATSVVIGAFIMNYFKLTEGRWILFTILSCHQRVIIISHDV